MSSNAFSVHLQQLLRDAEIEYRLNNGQHDMYPASWALPVAEVRRALAYFKREHQRPSFVVWHED